MTGSLLDRRVARMLQRAVALSVAALWTISGAEDAAAETLGDAVDAPELTWTTGGAQDWVAETETTHDGIDAAACGPLSHDGEGWIETSVTGPATVAFWWKTVSDRSWVAADLSVDGLRVLYAQGETPWEPRVWRVGAGAHLLRWKHLLYDGNPAITGQNRTWLDQVVVTNDAGLPPFFIHQPPALAVPEGYPWNSRLGAAVGGERPLSYQWLRGAAPLADGGRVGGARTDSLWFYRASTNESGVYRLVASNALGVATSEVAAATVVRSPPVAPWGPDDLELAPGGFGSISTFAYGSQPIFCQWESNGVAVAGANTYWCSVDAATVGGGVLYRAIVTNAFGAGTSRVARVTVSTNWPVITYGPDPSVLTANPGEEGGFNVWASGPQPLAYQWQRDGKPQEGATSSQLYFVGLDPTNSGTYRVVVSNSNGAVTSRAVILAVAPVDPIAVALNDTTLPVSNDLSSAWFTQTDVTHDGLAAAQSGAIGDYGESALATSVKGPGDVRFWWKISAAPRAFLEVSVDDVASVCLTGEVDWTEQSLTLREGMHSIRWRFHKLDAGYEGADAAWVDEVSTFTESPPTNQPPALTPLAGQWKYPGETCAFVAEAKGTAPFTYGWYRDGGPIEGQTGATLTVVADYPAAGEYSVVVSNAFGGDYSAARLVVAPVFYAMEDLGTLWPGPESESAAYGLNNRGDVVGYGVDAGSGARRACVWSGGTGTALTNPLGDADSLAYAINDAGDVVGTAAEPGGTNYHAICWRKTDSGYVADDLGRSNWPSAFGRSINNAGDIVIAMSDGPYKRRTLLWREGAMLSLNGLAPPWTNDVGDTSGWGLNSIGYVAGSAGTLTNGHWILRAWLYNGVYRRNMHDGGPIPNIPHVGAEGMSGGYAVNDFNDMAGLYGNILYSWMGAYVFSETNLFRAERYVYALNNCGDILVETGSDLALRCSTNARAPARLADGRPDYADHRLFSLKDLVPGGADPFVDLRIRLDVFGRMNHAREIASQGTTTGSVKRAVLLRPLPRPGNTAPVAQDDTVINSGVGLIIPLDALLANDSDADGDALALLTADGRSAQNATIRRSRNRLVYTPGGGLADPDTFRYLIQDFRGGVATGTVTVLMWPVGNTPPVNELKLFRVPGWAPFVRFRASPGETWRLQVCDDLEEDEWTTIGTAIAGADAVVDSGDLFLYTAPHRYYRAVSP